MSLIDMSLIDILMENYIFLRYEIDIPFKN